jgi:glucokinase
LAFRYWDLALNPLGPPYRKDFSPDTDFSRVLVNFLSDLPGPADEFGVGPLAGIGVVTPGPYDEGDDSVNSLQITGLRELPITGTIRRILDVPVAVGEDVHLAALAEAGPPHNARQPLFYLYVSHGVGGAYLSDGRILTGAGDLAGEIGQMVMNDGRRLEDTISWPAFLLDLKIPALSPEAEARDRINEKLDNDPDARGVFETLIERLALALSHAVCLFNPRSLIIGGAFEFLGDRFLRPLENALRGFLIEAHQKDLEISTSRHVDSGMARGAGMLILERWLETEFVT